MPNVLLKFFATLRRPVVFNAIYYGTLILLCFLSLGTPLFRVYPLELFSNFRVYYLLASLLLVVVVGQLKRTSQLAQLVVFGVLVFNIVWILPWYLPHPQQTSASDTQRMLRVLTFNINTENDHWDEIAEAVNRLNPDIAAIIETTAQAETALAQRLPKLPHTYRTTSVGMTIFSRLPLITPRTQVFPHGVVLVTQIQGGPAGEPVELVVTHPIVPIRPRQFQQRNLLLAELTEYLRQNPQPSRIVLGDFNLTPWSPYYIDWFKNTKLHNTRFGFGVEPSWIEPATYVHYPWPITAFLKIPIDHIFVTRNFKVADCHTQAAANADHRILWSDLVWTSKPEAG
jgi:endonuclease/exonuclease/phosphatase (EEP) superfamily protein YafD